ncbi:MAG: hypothetical protein H0Z40_01465 [Desulfotomaculum sp.]|nr:hypothetical protein [Desulfotomaculum sp.]
MPKLKDYLTSDIQTFLNQNEFAEIHNVNNVDVPAIVDKNVLKERPSGERAFPGDGIYTEELVLFVKLSDIGYQPVIGESLKLDGELFLVKDSSEEGGILEITLEANMT